MNSWVAVCLIAVAIADVGNAQTGIPPPVSAQIVAPVSQALVAQVPTTANPHDCDCDAECKDLHHSRVPFKAADIHNYLSYESSPILCRDASSTFFGGRKYTCKQTFDCCRKCNFLFYWCLTGKPFGNCIRSAYKCMCDCIDNRSFKELPFKRK